MRFLSLAPLFIIELQNMLNLRSLQQSQKVSRSLIRSRLFTSRSTRLVSPSTKKIATTATCTTITPPRQNNKFSTLWKTTGLLTATTLAYGLLRGNVHALEANDCKSVCQFYF